MIKNILKIQTGLYLRFMPNGDEVVIRNTSPNKWATKRIRGNHPLGIFPTLRQAIQQTDTINHNTGATA